MGSAKHRACAEHLRVLLVEDSPSDRRLIQDALRQVSREGFEVISASRLTDGIGLLAREGDIDVVLLDLALPDSQGLETFQSLRAACREIPVIILSGSLDDRLAINAVAEGAQDYIDKNSLAPELLVKTIRYALARSRINLLEKRQIQFEKEQAEEVARLKQEFLATMSHEIRTPLNGILGMTSLLGTTDLSEEQREYVHAIRGSGDVLIRIINEILDYSKIEAGKLELEKIEFDLRHVLEETLELYLELARRKNLVLTDIIDPDVPCLVEGDPTRLRQILANLISNAIKFTEKGEVIMMARVACENDKGTRLHFEVKDTGIGIALEAQKNLFQPFSQGDSSTSRRFGGTGLGLSITARLVSLLGGEIRLESKLGEGCRFVFEITLGRSADGRKFSPRPNLNGKRVLLAVPEPLLRNRIGEQLMLRGMIPEASGSLAAAETALREAKERGMPFDVVVRAPQWELGSQEKTLLLCPVGHPPSSPAGRKQVVLRTPFRQSELYRKIAGLIEGTSPASSLARTETPSQVSSPPQGSVLVVDDNEMNLQVTGRMLEKLGLSVDLAANGKQALQALDERPYSIVFLDCLMPEMDGYETAGRIRQKKTGSGLVPIIALTANTMAGEAQKCFACGMNDVLSKPITIERLASCLDRWLPAANKEIVRPEGKEKAADEGAILDKKTLGTLHSLDPDGNDSFLDEILSLFLEHAPPILPQLREAARRKDARAIKHLAHRIRGFCGNIGANRMLSRCATLEEKGRNGDLRGIEDQLDALESDLDAVLEAIRLEKGPTL